MTYSNIAFLEHINLTQPDQRLATAFYVSALGLTRDPYLMVGPDNMWINAGQSQIHLPTRAPRSQRLPGAIGLVVPLFDQLPERLAKAEIWLKDSLFSYQLNDNMVVANCPWGNRFECHPPNISFGNCVIGMPYLRVDVMRGTTDGIAKFYEKILGARVCRIKSEMPGCRVTTGREQWIDFIETDTALPDYDGHHIQIYIEDFEGPRHRLEAMTLLTQKNGNNEWRFTDITDPDSGQLLHRLEHEVRSLRHPLFGRVHTNRDPSLNTASYRHGRGPLQVYSPDTH